MIKILRFAENDVIRSKLRNRLVDVISQVEATEQLLDELRKADVITGNERAIVAGLTRRTDRIEKLVNFVLNSKHPSGCVLFLEILDRHHRRLSIKIQLTADGGGSAEMEPRLSRRNLNILLLGETGVGKSTWINAFSLYLRYANLGEALTTDRIDWPVPFSFDFVDDNYESQRICTGADENEDRNPGESSTQQPLTHVISTKEFTVRLIDTPGVGDTRGIEQDKRNFQLILDHIATLENLHAVCILLRSNNARLSIVFRFCIKELLTNLHRNACGNILFCFTSSKSSFFKPGDTLPALALLLRDYREIVLNGDTMFCVDNDAVRFLAARRNGVKFSEDDETQFAVSWEKSAKAIVKLMERVKTLRPHRVKNSLSVNDVRRRILQLDRPLTDLAQNIRENIRSIEDKTAELNVARKQMAADGDAVKRNDHKRLFLPRIELEIVPLPRPLLVCKSDGCTNEVTEGPTTKTEYLCSTVRTKYSFYRSSSCTRCGCSLDSHWKLKYDCIAIRKLAGDDDVDTSSTDDTAAIQSMEKQLAELKARQLQLEKEEKRVTDVSKKCGRYLRQNAVSPFNESASGYLDFVLNATVHTCKKISLRDVLKEHRHDVGILERAMQTQTLDSAGVEEPSLTGTEIGELIASLHDMKEMGPRLKEMMTAMEFAEENEIESEERKMDYESCRMPLAKDIESGAKSNPRRGRTQLRMALSVIDEELEFYQF